ncbi:MAG TPA: DMT family transporter [Chitinophagales bacterium]|nr:DMT family transporter [Chitinophagales bacterium]
MWKVHLILITVNLIYGANYTIAKEVMPVHIKPYGFVLLRVLCAAVLFFIVHSLWVKEKVQRKDFLRLFLCAFFGVALNQLLFLKGLDLTTPINASLMMITAPISVLLIAVFSRVEKFTFEKLTGVLLAAGGAAVVIYWGKHFTLNSNSFLGDIFVLINASSYAVFLVLAKPLMGKYNALTIVKWVFMFGLIFVIPAGWNEFREIHWQMPFPAWLCVAYVVLGATFFAYLLNVSALNKVDPSLVGIYIYSQPVIASAIALAFGKDELTWVKVLASALIFSGVYLVSSSQKFEINLPRTQSFNRKP